MLLLATAPAHAGQTHLFEEELSPSLSGAASIAVDQSTGDVLVLEAGAQRISRYNADGTPSNFSTLGTNVIDGAGPGGDETPQSGFGFNTSFASLYSQIAVDNSGAVTDGNIYVTQNTEGSSVHAIDIFASSGDYLGQITGAGATDFGSGPPSEGILSPCGVAVDPDGNLFAAGWGENKIYKFEPASNPPINADHKATIPLQQPCQMASGAGSSEGSLFVSEYLGKISKLKISSGAFECEVKGGQNHQLGVNPDDGHLFVAGGGSIVEYDTSDCPATLVSSFGAGGNGVAVDGSTGNVYVSRGDHLDVYGPLVPLPDSVTSPASEIAKTSATFNGTVETNGAELTECFFEYGTTTAYGQTVPCAESPAEIGTGVKAVHADVSGLAEETVYHFRLIAGNSNGRGEPGENVSFQTVSKPEILGSWSEDVIFNEAKLRARVNPQSAETTCRFEWGTSSSYGNTTPDTTIDSEPVPHTVGFSLQGLAAGTTYHFRVVCENEMGTSEGPDRAFITLRPSPQGPIDDPCSNKTFRTGPSAFLPDCRAYEMVSPVDKGGNGIWREAGSGPGDPAGYVRATPQGGRVTYTANASFSGTPSAYRLNQYLATRVEQGEPDEGWSNEGLNVPVRGQEAVPDSDTFGFTRYFIDFTGDLCSTWLIDFQTPPPTGDGQEGLPNLYRRGNCGIGAGALEALTPNPLVDLDPLTVKGGYVTSRSVQGHSADGSLAFFTAQAELTEEAEAGTAEQAYVRSSASAVPRVVSVLGGKGVGGVIGGGWGGALDNAVSADGSRVYWSAGSSIYVRIHPEQGIATGECDEAEQVSCTIAVSQLPPASYRGAASDGSKALYLEEGEGKLVVFDLEHQLAKEGGVWRTVATGAKGVVAAADDLSRIYFVSTEAIAGAGPNSELDEAVGGHPNLYLDENGEVSFIGTLLTGDTGEKEPSAPVHAYDLVARQGVLRGADVTPDGSRLAFQSRASLTGYDSTDSATDKAAVEVFTYDAVTGNLRCASCDPSRARPDANEMLEPFMPPWGTRPTRVPAAAWIPGWEQPTNAPETLSDDGGRLFFNSNDALLPRDANGVQDVYMWQALGTGGCDKDSLSFFEENGGCLALISSGDSPEASEFWAASADGDDVFFTTEASLVGKDPKGTFDLYDARVGGGFPEPTQKAECGGDACQSPPFPPEFPAPASGTTGPSNPPYLRPCGRIARQAARLSRQVKRARRAARQIDSPAGAMRMRRNSRQLAEEAKRMSRRASACRKANRGPTGSGGREG